MKIEFSRHNNSCLNAAYTAAPGEYHRERGTFICDDWLTRIQHEGYWDCRMLAFMPAKEKQQ